MSSILKVDTIQDQDGNNIINESGNVITIGASGDTITVPAGATVSGFTSAGIDDNATSTAITISSDEDVTFTEDIKLGDGKKAIFGAGSDLQIFHDGSNSYVSDYGTGFLVVQTNGSGILFQNENGTEGLAKFLKDGAVELNYDNSKKFETTSAGATVTGTATVTGDLTVDTNTLFVDASENTVVIGGTDATSWNANADELVVAGASAGGMTFYNPTQSNIFFADGTSGSDVSRGRIQYVHSGDSLLFGTDATERARFDGSGNLFVAKTSAAYQTVGHELLASGRAFHTANGGKTLSLNRLTNDGAIVDFYRNGTEIGSIETVGVSTSGRLVVKSTTFDGYLDRAGTTIAKWMSSSFTPGADNTFDLGRGAERWQDIYLSGGAYLGGTGSSNQLSDYEEGTWSPAITTDGGGGNSGVTYGDRYGTYTKIGRIVTVHVFCNLDAVSTFGTGNAIISTLPFSSNSASQYRSGVVIGYAKNWNNAPSGGTISTNANTIYLRKRNSTSALSNFTDVVQVGDMNTNSEIILTATYETD